jgi:hypothetical protein
MNKKVKIKKPLYLPPLLEQEKNEPVHIDRAGSNSEKFDVVFTSQGEGFYLKINMEETPVVFDLDEIEMLAKWERQWVSMILIRTH